MDALTLVVLFSIPMIVVVARRAVDAAFWCFCWLFCKVDDRVQKWGYGKVTAKDIEALAREFNKAA